MPAGRPPLGLDLLDRIDCTEEERLKARTILETVSGEKTVAQACEILGVGESRFREMREDFLVAGVVSVAPKPRGRPRKAEETAQDEMEALKRENAELREELVFARARTVLATAFPHLVKDPADQKKTDLRKAKRRKRKAERNRKKRGG